MQEKKRILVYDTTLRDGEQAPGFNMTADQKFVMAQQLIDLGVDVIEAGFPVASNEDYLAVKRICELASTTVVSALARARQKDIDMAWNALKNAVLPRIHVFIPSSAIQIRNQLKKTDDEVIQQAVEAVSYARQYTEDVQFSAMDATRSDKHFLAVLLSRVIDAGALVVNLSDTVGYATPGELAGLIRFLKQNVAKLDTVKLSVHCHNDLGMATANTIGAIEAGVDQVEGTINGIGERAGNAALEEIIMALDVRNDYYNRYYTTINKNKILKTSRLLEEITGTSVQPNKAIVGRNAFAHQSGIHQDGLVKSKDTYELFAPERIGDSSSRFVLGRHSGRSGLKKNLEMLGISDEGLDVQAVLDKIKDQVYVNKVFKRDELLDIIQATRQNN